MIIVTPQFSKNVDKKTIENFDKGHATTFLIFSILMALLIMMVIAVMYSGSGRKNKAVIPPLYSQSSKEDNVKKINTPDKTGLEKNNGTRSK